MMHEAAGPHLIRDRGTRLSTLHRRLDLLELKLRLRAEAAGEDDQATPSELRQRLEAWTRNPNYHGPERRARPAAPVVQLG